MLVYINFVRDNKAIVVNTNTWYAVGYEFHSQNPVDLLREFWEMPLSAKIKLSGENRRYVASIIRNGLKNSVVDGIRFRPIYVMDEEPEMPFDRDFGHGLIHATGRQYFDADRWWDEFYDERRNEYYYG